jgi:hypothetical protein
MRQEYRLRVSENRGLTGKAGPNLEKVTRESRQIRINKFNLYSSENLGYQNKDKDCHA